MGQPGDVERLFVQCAPGLEGVLEVEAGRSGASARVSGGVEVEGTAGLHAQAALVLRVAERILLRLSESPARHWARGGGGRSGVSPGWGGRARSSGGARAVASHCRSARRGRASRSARAALGPRGAARVGRGPRGQGWCGWCCGWWTGPRRSPPTSAGRCSTDADGARSSPGHRCARRSPPAVLALAGHSPQVPLWDPVCGSGTLVIEAALVARGVAPGLGRSFAAEAWPMARAAPTGPDDGSGSGRGCGPAHRRPSSAAT